MHRRNLLKLTGATLGSTLSHIPPELEALYFEALFPPRIGEKQRLKLIRDSDELSTNITHHIKYSGGWDGVAVIRRSSPSILVLSPTERFYVDSFLEASREIHSMLS